jgi:hypothetical protein
MQLTFDYLLEDGASGAIIDSTKRFRYSLWRCWQSQAPRVSFIMLNPSTADEQKNDPTITRCINFAKKWGFGSIEVVNLFAYRATNPEELWRVKDPVGPRNDEYILEALKRSQVAILAWGTRGTFLNRNKHVLDLISSFDLYALELSKDGHPKHPLYIRADKAPFPYLYV